MKKDVFGIGGGLAGAALALTAYAFAGQSGGRTGQITPWKAMSIAEQRTGGRALQAVYEYEDGRWGYAVIIVKKHKLMEVELDKNMGKIGDTESADPAGEAQEFEANLKRATR